MAFLRLPSSVLQIRERPGPGQVRQVLYSF